MKRMESMQKDFDMEKNRHKRAKWYTGVLGVFAVLIGAVLFYMVFMMTRDMNRMEAYMYNMGHADGDEITKSVNGKYKQAGTSYMMSMADDMQTMRSDMGLMRQDMGQMRNSMSSMDGNMDTMAGDMGSMSNDMTVMNGTMGRMQHDTLWMRQGVGSMASDTNQMGTPFRWMNSMTPW
jgi:methyl-accepting chemotaxis protein